MGSTSWTRSCCGGGGATARAAIIPLVAVLMLFLGVPWVTPAGGVANPAADLDQCANGPVDAPATCVDANWVNGNLGASKAHYAEGDSVPYRVRMSNLSIGETHTVTFEWDTTKAGVHALDYLTTYNRTETDAMPTSGVAGLDPAIYDTYPIPLDATMALQPDWTGAQVPGEFTMWGGDITAASAYTYSGSWTGDSAARITITFTATTANPVLAWGGHIASRLNWGAGGSAVSIPGSPFHMRLIDLDGSGGNQDRSLSNEAVIFPASITIVKDAVPDSTAVFSYTASPAPLTGFTLVDDGDPAAPVRSQSFTNITTFGTYTVTEAAVSGWTLTNLVCADPSDGSTADLGTRTASIDLDEGEDITCTFTNTRNPSITVIKEASPTSLPEPGANVTFTVTITNDSAVSAVTISSLVDTVYGNLDGKGTCDVPQTIAASGSYSCTFVGAVAGNAGSTHTDTVTASGTSAIGTPVSDSDDATVTITDAQPSISVTKTASPTTVPETGGNVTFTYTVTNLTTEAVTITALSDDEFGTLTGDADCAVDTVLAGGGSCTFDATFAVPAGDYPGSHVDTFSATAADDEGNTDTATDDATVTYTDVLPDISVTKTASPTSVPETGGNVTFTYTVTNNSLESASITALSDNRFGALTGDGDCHVGTVLAAGATCSFSATFAVPAGDYPGSHIDVFTATASDGDGNSDTATDDATVTYTDVLPDISVTKTASPTSVPETGGNVTFTYTVTNNSAEAATITVLSDNRFGALAGDADCHVGTVLTAGGSCSFSATFAVPAGDYPGSHIDVFTATASDGDGNSDTATDDATVTYTDVLPDITVTKTASPTSVPETGGNVLFTYTITNNSLEPATITVLSDDKFGALAGDADCQIGTVLASGASCTFSDLHFIAGDTPASHVNVFTATATDGDGNNDTATDDATVLFTDVLPDISVTKTASPTSVPETGANVTFTYSITNNSSEAATITVLSDSVFGALAGDADCHVGTVLAPHSSCSFSAVHFIGGDFGTDHHNVFTATVTDDDGNTDTATDPADVVLTDVLPDISVTKTASPTSVPETGGNVAFTYVVTNNGAEAAAITALSDDRFGALTGDGDCHVGTVLAGGESCSFSATFAVPAGDYPGNHVDVFTATAADDDGNTDTATDPATVTYTDVLPDITVTKTASPTSVAETGGNVLFTYTVTNNSLEAASITALSDNRFGALAGDADCHVGTVLAAGATCSFSATFAVPADDYPGSHVDVFTATVSDGDGNSDTATDDAAVTYTDVLPDISVTKTANPTSVPETGGNVLFTYTVTNHSAEAATITVLSDSVFGALAGDVDCQIGTVLASGASCTFSDLHFIAGDTPSTHVNVFTATATDGDGNNDTATDDATVLFTDVVPDISVTKSASPTSVPETGGNVTFTYTVTNHSAEAATITSLSDDRFGALAGDGDCQIGTVLAGGASCTFSATFAVPAGDYPGSHTDVFTATVSDGDGNSDTATDDATVLFTDVLPDISVTKTASPTSVPETGGNVAFTYTVTNNSAEAATITVLADDRFGALAGDGDCQVGTVLAAGASCTFSASFPVPAGDYPGTHVDVFTATVTDGDGNDDTATDHAVVTYTDVLPDISVTKTASPTSIAETGGDVTFTYTVTNHSLEPATITVLTDDVFGPLAGDGDCKVGTVLGAGASCTFTATFAVPAGDHPATHVDVFTATVTDGDGNDDTATDDATVTYTDVLPDVTVTKTASKTTVPETGGDVTFTYTVTNHSLEAATITVLTDDVFGPLAGDADCKLGTVLQGGASCTFSLTKRIEGTAEGFGHHNVVTVTVTDDDGNTDTATDDEVVTFTDVKPQIDIAKVPSATTVEAGSDVTYTYRVTNPGAEPVRSVTVSDDKCSPVTFAGGDADGDAEVDSAETWTFTCTTKLTGTTTNVGTVTGSDDEGNTITDTATAKVVVLNPKIAIDKTASTGSARVGGTVTYTYVVTNPGDAALTDVVVTDDKCSPLTFVSGDTDGDKALDPGETWSYTCTATMPSMDGLLTNIGSVSAVDQLGAKVGATDTATVDVSPVEVLGVVIARTGAEVVRIVLAAIAAIGLGIVLVVASRRRYSHR